LGLSLGVFFGLLADRRLIACYHGLHFWPTMAGLPWFMLPPWGLVSLAVAGALLLSTLLAGRLYCSFLCPVGFLQELARRLGKALGWAGQPTRGWTAVRLLVLALCAALLARRSSAYLYFDHFSSLGRVYGLAHALRAGGPFGANFFLGLAFLVVLLAVPLRWPRWFCGALCPSGTIFMLMQAVAPGKVRSRNCGGQCGNCAKICPALCISDGRIDGKLCINCLECSSACAKKALAFSFRWPWARPAAAAVGPDALSRREFLAGAGFSAAGWSAGSWLKRLLLGLGPAAAVVPPGGKAYASFLERCVACDTCVSVCPSGVLVPAGRGLGLSGLAKVRLDYGASYCAYECNACLAVCPSGAISYFPLAAKKRIRIGKSRLIKEICIPYAFERDCGACQEQCPSGALSMEPYKSVHAPVQHEDYCIGCGACQFACPTRPRKAIVVDPVEVHAFASPPKRGSKVDCRACSEGKGGQACWRCRPAAAEAAGGFPF
jgi:polyferredoxin